MNIRSKPRFSMLVLVLMAASSTIAFALFSDVRLPAVAGAFYPGTRNALARKVDSFLENVKQTEVKGKLIALIVPHAGYDYSGQVAAFGYKELEGRRFKRVILMGASHQVCFDGISAGDYDRYQTPLGEVKVDRKFIDKLIKSGGKIGFIRDAHCREHSLEVQLPFLQRTLKHDFKLVPLIFGNQSYDNCKFLALSLIKLVDDETLIVCSTDWSHYHDYLTATAMDRAAIQAVVTNDIASFAAMLEKGSCEACAAPAVITTMLVAPAVGANRTYLLKYANSGDVSGDRKKVVGYASIAYAYESSPLTSGQKRTLLKVARQTLEHHLSGKKLPVVAAGAGLLAERRGAFVTLNKHGRLRGCIGYIQPVKPLAEAVQEMALAAATRDDRFPPVKHEELKDIEIEISVLSRLERVKDVSEIKIGRDGLYIIQGRRSGLLLPQVATEWGYGRGEFLEQVCRKARLDKDAWKDKDSILYRFTADIFHE